MRAFWKHGALLVVLGALTSCNFSLVPAGKFTVAFKWKGGAPPSSLTYPLFVSARIVDAAKPTTTIAGGEPKE
jgi:hypothetical protein